MDFGILQWVIGLRTPFLNSLFYLITSLGSETFYLVVLTFIYWCVNKPLGYSLGQLTVFSSMLNTGLKEAFKIGRPADKWPGQVAVLHPETGGGYGFPSGHAQGAGTFWGYLGLRTRRAWVALLSLVTMLAIGFSRVYLAVHSPSDVLAGWGIGLVVAALYLWLSGIFERRVHLSFGAALAAGVFVPLLLLPLNFTINGFKMVGLLMGVMVARVLEERYVRFDVRASWPAQAAKLAIGLGGIMALRIGLKPALDALIPTIGPLAARIGTVGAADAFTLADGIAAALRYGLMGLYGIYLAPLLFKAFHLSPTEPEKAKAKTAA